MDELKIFINGLILTINCSAVAIICLALSRWLKRMDLRSLAMYESFGELNEAITRCNLNAIGIHIEHLRLQLHLLGQKEEYEAMGKIKKELDRSLEIYNRLENQLKEMMNETK